ncbi:MAG: caspase family protein [Chitinophagaceae bacterium]|nr:caspase family protein [Chitinophagaceae bacterium]
MCWANVFAQTAPAIHALVIGISKYQDNGIRSLQFAADDAVKFVEFLKSPAGGNVPSENIKLLLNERATTAEIDLALDQLFSRVQKNDRVYFYFAGHGDMETKTFANLGFLLAYNTPRFNYTRNAIRIEDINLFVTTLSTKKDAEVIVITDACHSGKLAGDRFNGRRVVGEALRRVEQNEVRLASCEPDQLSNESESWGGGRGVFSYYLIKGLEGEASRDSSKEVTVGEIKDYLEKSLINDQFLKMQNINQSPVILGNKAIRLSNPVQIPFGSASTRQEASAEPASVFEEQLRKLNLEKLIDFSKVDTQDMSKMRARIFETILGNNMMFQETYEPIDRFYRMTQRNASFARMADESIASVLHEKGQEVINDYLNGDLAELEKRNYYNIKNGEYDRYVNMYRVALMLLQPQGRLYQRVLVTSKYFEGLLYRLKMPLYADNKPLADTAMSIMYEALALEKQAAYIYNELANLHAIKGKVDSALFYYNKAIDFAPSWAVPLANMVGLYNSLGNLKLARQMADKARALQPGLVSLMMQEGVTEEISGNWLRAEEMQLRSLQSSKMHYFPYERLGFIYAATARFALADSFFYQAERTREGYYLPPAGNPISAIEFTPPQLLKSTGPCFLGQDLTADSDIYLLAIGGIEFLEQKNIEMAGSLFEWAYQKAPDNFIVLYHYARFLFASDRIGEAEVLFSKSQEFRFGENIWDVIGHRNLPVIPEMDSICLKLLYERLFFPISHLHFYLGRIFETLGYFERAEAEYQRIYSGSGINQKIIGVNLLASLYKKTGQFYSLEKLWQQYPKIIQSSGHEIDPLNENFLIFYNFSISGVDLRNFYLDMVNIFPNSFYWHSRLADHLNERITNMSGSVFNPSDFTENAHEGYSEKTINNYKAGMQGLLSDILSKFPVERDQIKFNLPLSAPLRVTIEAHQKALSLAVNNEDIYRYHLQLASIYLLIRNYHAAASLFARATSFQPGTMNAGLKPLLLFIRVYIIRIVSRNWIPFFQIMPYWERIICCLLK